MVETNQVIEHANANGDAVDQICLESRNVLREAEQIRQLALKELDQVDITANISKQTRFIQKVSEQIDKQNEFLEDINKKFNWKNMLQFIGLVARRIFSFLRSCFCQTSYLISFVMGAVVILLLR